MRKILSVAFCTLATSVAFSQAGAPLTSFGTNGSTSKTVDQGNQTWSMGIQNDGKVIVAGASAAVGGSGHRFTLVRYNANGTVDNSFDGDGAAVTLFYNYEWVKGIAVNNVNGKIAAVGYTYTGSAGHMAIAVYNPDGSLDLSFSGDGKHVETTLPSSSASAVAWQSDGKLLVSGGNLVRYNSNGTLDVSFSGDGVAPVGGSAMLLMDDGKIIVGSSSGNLFTISRLNSDGSLDASYDGDGIAQISVGTAGQAILNSIAMQPDGKIVAVGYDYYMDWMDMTHNQVALARFNSNGTADATFDGDGKLIISESIYSYGQAKSVAVQKNDGKIVVTGQGMGVARFNDNGTFDATFDGDGRAALGISGVGVELFQNRIYVASSTGGNFYLSALQNDVTVLPVKLSAFDAAKKNTAVQLNWSTSSEQNTSHFDIERSSDGRTFTKIGSVTAGGSNYSFTDNTPAPSVNYYKLKIVDKDGKQAYSKTVGVKLNAKGLEVYPTIATSTINVHTGINVSNLLVMDASGRTVKSVAVSNASSTTFDISNLVNGVYFIKAGTETVQFVKK